MPEGARTKAAKIALSLAIASSVVVAAAIVVTVVRSHARTERSRHPRAEKVDTAGVIVRATDVLRLDGAVDASGAGVHVNDRALAAALRLRDSDIITAISGRIVRGAADVTSAISSMFMLDPSAVYVDVVRDGQPLLLKWQVDGNMRDALADLHRDLGRKTVRKFGSVSPQSSAPGTLFDPFASAHAPVDRIVATVTPIAGDHFALPIATFRILFDDPATAISTGLIAPIKLVPIERDSRSVNRLFGIRPSTIWYALGLRNGDIVLAANAQPVGFSSLFDNTRHLVNADTIVLSIERSGASLELRYDVTP
ncbi:MAG TPA: hypothetical protein VGM90_24355 [Kofleriaceae bacterium]|jgi:hypothetical protein